MILRLRRKLNLDTILLGVALILSVMAADHYGLLTSLENWAYDKRALTCQFFTPPPTDKLVHLDIDDRALDVIGDWPWPRGKNCRDVRRAATGGAEGCGAGHHL